MPGPDGRVVVVGAGLAGLAAALDLAEAGVRPLLLERRPFVGGKTFSFTDPASGVEFDNGQHIFLRCCTAYRAFVDRIGAGDLVTLQPRLRVPVLDPASGRIAVIRAGRGLPAPMHLTGSVLRFAHLSFREKLRLGRPLAAMLRLGDSGRRRLDHLSFADWLRAHGQSDAVIARFWDLIVLPTCNETSERVSAQQAILVFQVGLLRDAHAADIGWARVGLSAVAERARERAQAAGAEVRGGTAARRLLTDGGRVTGLETRDGETLPAARVILALPPDRTLALLPDAWRGVPPFAALAEFRTAPIANVSVHWDRPVLPEPMLAVLDPDVQYVFDRTAILGRQDGGQWTVCSLSAAHAALKRGKAAQTAHTIRALRHALPAARDAGVLASHTVIERDATFVPGPGVGAWRPGPRPPVGGLYLAGAWTATEWPATMESALRSGHAAARALLAERSS